MLNAPLRKYRLHFAFFIFTVTANLSITISIERAYAQVADESVVSPALRISPIPERRVLEEADLFAVDECLSASFRCIDGTGNNVDDPFLGAAGTQLLRHVDAAYGNGFNSLRSGPNPRLISNAVNAQLVSIHNELSASDFVWAWGQFLDHDIDLTIEADDPLEPEPIPVLPPDPFFDPDGTGTQEIAFNRSNYDPATGTDPTNPRQQINFITAFIDGSNVYGSDHTRADALRDETLGTGRLRTNDGGDHGDLLPFNYRYPDDETGNFLPNANGPVTDPDDLFLAGDVRANEQALLTALHTLFVREHNRWAALIAADDPSLTDEEIYQKARQLVGAEIQSITYKEFLPVLLGKGALGKYKGYVASVDPGIANVFSTAAFRLGHSMLNLELKRLDAEYDEITGQEKSFCNGHLPLRDAFFRPEMIRFCGIASLLRGAVTIPAQTVDTLIIDDVRNFLFGPPGAGGFDLASLNIQRGRDHGIPDINTVREAYGLSYVVSFDELTSDLETSDRLAEIYGDPDNCDAWICMLAEDHVKGALVGKTIQTILIDQFERLRDGDRFWYELTLTRQELRELPTLGEILEMNADIPGIVDPFHVQQKGKQKRGP
jgi:hypothetical protein